MGASPPGPGPTRDLTSWQLVAQQTIEGRRQTEQTRLDSLKTAAERNKWGQFATPFELALSLARYAHKTLGEGRLRFLDPAIGTGSFYSALSQAVPGKENRSSDRHRA